MNWRPYMTGFALYSSDGTILASMCFHSMRWHLNLFAEQYHSDFRYDDVEAAKLAFTEMVKAKFQTIAKEFG